MPEDKLLCTYCCTVTRIIIVLVKMITYNQFKEKLTWKIRKSTIIFIFTLSSKKHWTDFRVKSDSMLQESKVINPCWL